ncbi:MAG TPA: DUF2452 domain-containing protein [Candidatus Acidoferrum sp.]|nr:DUF2452 domain-containing protein [Candidatus Acidoferrum sp.]
MTRTMKKNPNPQGKGLVPVLQGVQQHAQRLAVPPKPLQQIEMELFTSLFVLQSEIRFNPVVGRAYWLYRRDDGYRLSLVAPDEWHRPLAQCYIGRCELQTDRTWTLELSAEASADESFMAMIERQRAMLHAALEAAERVEDVLPVFAPALNYHGRILAFILGKSLRSSMQLAGIAALPFREAAAVLPED